MNKKTLFAAAIIVIVLLVGSNIYFIAQSGRLSAQLMQVSAIVRETAKNKVTDNEYYLRREYARIQATDDQIAGLRILAPGGSETRSLADFAAKGNDDGRRLYMYFSPNVCEACLYNEMEMQDSLHAQSRFDRKVTILASKEYAQNLRAKFQGRALSCDYAVVDYESIDPESILVTMNEPLLFRWEGDRARDIFVPSKSNRRYSEMYYSYLGGY